MEYPRKPQFANIFWYNVVINDGSTWLCSTTGLEFIYQLQRVLQEAGIASAPSYDGVSAGSSDIEADGAWGPTTQRVLYLAATQPGTSAGIPTEYITALAANGRSHVVGFSSVYVAIYVMMSLSASSGLFIESGTGMEILRVQAFDPPHWGVRPHAVGVHNPPRNITCVLQVPSSTPGVPIVPAGEPAEPATPAPGTPAPAPGTPALLIPVGPPATRVDVHAPPGRQPTTVTQEGITIGPILVAVGVLGLIVWGASEVMKARKNPHGPRDLHITWDRPNPHAPRNLFSNDGIDGVFRERNLRFTDSPKLHHYPIGLSKPEARRVMSHYFGDSAKMPHQGESVKLTDRYILTNQSGSFEIARRS